MSQAAFVGAIIDARTADSSPTAVILRVSVTYIDTNGRANSLPIEATIDVADAVGQIETKIRQAVIDAGPTVGDGYIVDVTTVVRP